MIFNDLNKLPIHPHTMQCAGLGIPVSRSVNSTAVHNAPHVCTINPRRACAARVTVVVLCLSVCLSVYDYSRTTGYEAAHERYQQLQCHKGLKTNVAILLKPLRSGDMA